MRTYTIGYISHDPVVFDKYLGPSLESLDGDFVVISTSDKAYPAENYNTIISCCDTDYLILTHQDVSFPPNLLSAIDKTIDAVGEESLGVLGMVGMHPDHPDLQLHSTADKVHLVDTVDCCFAVVNPRLNARFDSENFGEYHLYVEDYCAQMNRTLGRNNYTILIDSGVDEIMDSNNNDGFVRDKLRHHSATVSKLGSAWGRYWEFRDVLTKKWGNLKTT